MSDDWRDPVQWACVALGILCALLPWRRLRQGTQRGAARWVAAFERLFGGRR